MVPGLPGAESITIRERRPTRRTGPDRRGRRRGGPRRLPHRRPGALRRIHRPHAGAVEGRPLRDQGTPLPADAGDVQPDPLLRGPPPAARIDLRRRGAVRDVSQPAAQDEDRGDARGLHSGHPRSPLSGAGRRQGRHRRRGPHRHARARDAGHLRAAVRDRRPRDRRHVRDAAAGRHRRGPVGTVRARAEVELVLPEPDRAQSPARRPGQGTGEHRDGARGARDGRSARDGQRRSDSHHDCGRLPGGILGDGVRRHPPAAGGREDGWPDRLGGAQGRTGASAGGRRVRPRQPEGFDQLQPDLPAVL